MSDLIRVLGIGGNIIEPIGNVQRCRYESESGGGNIIGNGTNSEVPVKKRPQARSPTCRYERS